MSAVYDIEFLALKISSNHAKLSQYRHKVPQPKFLYSPRIAVLHNLFCMVFEQNSAILDMKKPLGKDMAWEIPL